MDVFFLLPLPGLEGINLALRAALLSSPAEEAKLTLGFQSAARWLDIEGKRQNDTSLSSLGGEAGCLASFLGPGRPTTKDIRIWGRPSPGNAGRAWKIYAV